MSQQPNVRNIFAARRIETVVAPSECADEVITGAVMGGSTGGLVAGPFGAIVGGALGILGGGAYCVMKAVA